MPGSVVLSGFPALPWGHMSMGPRPASLAPVEAMGVSMVALEELADETRDEIKDIRRQRRKLRRQLGAMSKRERESDESGEDERAHADVV